MVGIKDVFQMCEVPGAGSHYIGEAFLVFVFSILLRLKVVLVPAVSVCVCIV
jgi:hypothetical protein